MAREGRREGEGEEGEGGGGGGKGEGKKREKEEEEEKAVAARRLGREGRRRREEEEGGRKERVVVRYAHASVVTLQYYPFPTCFHQYLPDFNNFHIAGENPVSRQDNNIYILDTTSWEWTTSFNTAHGPPSFSPSSISTSTAIPTASIPIPTFTPTTITTTSPSVSSVSSSPVPQTNLASTPTILGTSIGGTFVFFAAAGAFFLYRRRRSKANGAGQSFVIDRSTPPDRYSPDSYDRSRKHLSWNLPSEHQGDSVAPPAPVAYADWATTVYRQASRRASWYYRDGPSLAPLSEERIGLRDEEKAPEGGPTVERVMIEEDVIDPEELYRHMDIQTIAVPKQVLYVVNRD